MSLGKRGKVGQPGKEPGGQVQAKRVSPGKRTLTGRLPPVQARGPMPADGNGGAVAERAAQGVGAGYGSPIPSIDQIQESFGRHDVGGIEAHVGGAAGEAAADIGALAYATGNQVAFATQPDLHTAAHEAAHVVQQRGGVQLVDGVGRAGDIYEQHADAVADRVVKGESAEGLLDHMAGPSSGGAQSRHDPGAVQRRGDGKETAEPVAGRTTASTGATAAATRAAQPFDTRLCGVLEQNVGDGDDQAIQGRKQLLLASFRAMSPDQRAALLARLNHPAHGDRLAELFQERLATATRRSLIAVLREAPEPTGDATAAESAPAEKRDAASPGAGKEDTWQAVLGEASTPVGRMGRVEAPKGLRLRPNPAGSAPTLAILPFDTLVHVERRTQHGWYYVVSMGGAKEGGSVTGTGCVEGQYVELDPPEPTAHLHYVKPGEMLKDIAAQHYKPKRGFDWGADARLYVEAIWEANKDTGKLLRSGGDLSWSEKAVRSEQQEKTLAIWRSVQPKQNHAIWIPSQEFVAALEQQGAISGGSISHAAWEAAKQAGEAFVEFVKYGAGFVVGVLEGAFAAARDLVMGVVDLLGLLYDLVKSLIGEGLVGTAQSIGHKLVTVFKNAPGLLKQAGTWFLEKWTQENDFDRGEFHGEVVGYILMQVLIVILTMGGSAAMQASGRFASLIKVVRTLDAAGDILTYARGAARAVKLPAEALARMRRAGGRAGDIVEAATDGAGDAARRAGRAAEHPGPAHRAGDAAGPTTAGTTPATTPARATPGGPPASLSPRAAKAADELTRLLERDPDTFIKRYHELAASLQPDELAALKDTIRTRGRISPSATAGLKPQQLIELHRKRVIALREIGEFEQMSFHGTGSSMLDGLARTDGEILPAAELHSRNIAMNTGEGPKFTPRGGHKKFVSVGQGESGFGTSLAYADVSKNVAHYNPQLLSDAELKSQIGRLETIVDNFDTVRVDVPDGPYGQMVRRDKEHFTFDLEKLRRELNSRKGLPSDSPRRLGGHPDPDNHPVLFEFDTTGMEGKIEQFGRTPGQALGGEAAVHGAIDLKKRLRRVYCPAENVQAVTQKLQKIFGHSDFEVIAIEALDNIPSPGVLGSSRSSTYGGLRDMEQRMGQIELAWEAAIRQKRPLDMKLVFEQPLGR